MFLQTLGKEILNCYSHTETRCSSVAYSVFLMHRRKDLWGPDGEHVIVVNLALAPILMYGLTAEEFDPDRFLDERLRKYLTPNPFIFSPFNAGPRICMGQQVGMLLLSQFFY